MSEYNNVAVLTFFSAPSKFNFYLYDFDNERLGEIELGICENLIAENMWETKISRKGDIVLLIGSCGKILVYHKNYSKPIRNLDYDYKFDDITIHCKDILLNE